MTKRRICTTRNEERKAGVSIASLFNDVSRAWK